MVAGFAEPVVGGLDGFENWIRCAALRAGGEVVFRRFRFFFQLFDDFLWDWLLDDHPSLIELVGTDVDLDVANAELIPGNYKLRAGPLNPGVYAGSAQHLGTSGGFVEGFAAAESDFPGVVDRLFFSGRIMLMICGGVVLPLPMYFRTSWLMSGPEARSVAVTSNAALLHFVAQDVLSCRSEVIDLVGEFFYFCIAHLVVERREPTPFFDWI